MFRPTDEDVDWVRTMLVEFAATRAENLRSEIAVRTNWLAVRGARRFSDRGEPFDDLLQVARLGLLKAIDRFDPAREIQFSAYATPTIMGELRRHFRDHTWSVHVPRRAKDLRPAVNGAAEDLTRTLGRSPTPADIAKHIGASEDSVLEALEANSAYRASSLDVPGVDHADRSDGQFDGVVNRDVVLKLLDRLRPRERSILYLRFYEELTQAEIAERIGTSQVHVGRLLAASLVTLRTHIEDSSVDLSQSTAG